MPSMEDEYAEIHRKEFSPIDVEGVYAGLNLYSGSATMESFELASSLQAINAGKTIHELRMDLIADRFNVPRTKPLSIVTYSSKRVLAPFKGKTPPNVHPLCLAKSVDGRHVGFQPNRHALPHHGYDQTRWTRDNEDAIVRAIAADADIVCLGEFDFPPADVYGSPGESRESLAALVGHRAWIKQRLAAAQRPIFLFAGSSHCWKPRGGCANIGRIFISERRRPEGDFRVHTMSYEKRVSAKPLGECLMPHPDHRLPCFGTSVVKVGVLICIEAFDPGIVNAIFANSREDNIHRLQVILVPSYNPSRKLVRSCQMLSYLANCAVVYVNAFGGTEHDGAEVFLSGIPLRVWQAQLSNVANIILKGVALDAKVVESIPGVRTLARLADLADVGRSIRIEPLDDLHKLIKWSFPLEFLMTAAETMTEKFPFGRRRLIANLPRVNGSDGTAGHALSSSG